MQFRPEDTSLLVKTKPKQPYAVYYTTLPEKSQYKGAKKMDDILTLVLTSVITFLVYEVMRSLFDKIKGKRGKKR